MLLIENLNKNFGEKTVLSNIDLKVETGTFVGVIGRSGAGKSTLLRAINRLSDANSGRISWKGGPVSGLRGRDLASWRANCAMIFQQFNLAGRLDVMTNVLMGRLNHVPTWHSLLNLWTAEERALAFSTLAQFDIAHLAAQRAETLSGGEQQRVAIARAMMQEPDLILADEPIASLDPRNTQVVMDALRRINRHFGITVLCNLHSLDLARTYCDRLIGMSQGRIVFDDVPEALTESKAREMYGIEAGDVTGPGTANQPNSSAALPSYA